MGFWIGAAIGSFLNVVIYRMPRGISIYKPAHSFCPSCQKQLTPRELVPLLSWAFQGGRCACGKNKIGARYQVVEVVTGILFAAIWYQQLCADPLSSSDPVFVIKAVGYMLFSAALVAAIFTDLAHYIIPDQINAFMLFAGLGMNVAYASVGAKEAWVGGMPSSIAGALTGVGVLWGIAFLGRVLFRKDAMGHGDIKMARGIGAVLLPMGAGMSFAMAVALGAVIGAIQIAMFRSKPVPDNGSADEPAPEPEPIGSLLKCGLGYVLCMDVFGLVWPKIYEWWFGENPYSIEEFEEEPEVEHTMIPFGPYLAAGALAVVLFAPQLELVVDAYKKYIGLE
ncbi:MAG: prepilin peptidase [Armatimonadetes bacterium]|nr:prepilin peptidase [Armatimonadota bacterium]MBS1712268.1 prepilin peptidase [Armatimonadota bacterium]MBX3107975.1 prepilin peptidase [Fimbriimonadaceae bacterium]